MLKSILSALSIITILAAAPAIAEEKTLDRVISVTGQGEVFSAPDAATVSLGLISNAPTAREALDANSKNMAALIDVLHKAGVESRDISTSNFSVGPRYDYNNSTQTPKILGYDVNNQVTVILRKVDDLGAMLDVAVSAGSNQINGVSFMTTNPTAHLDEARKLAIADARRKAEVYAAAGGFKLGKLISLSEGTAFQPVQPYALKAGEAANDAVPVERGVQALTVTVSVSYEVN